MVIVDAALIEGGRFIVLADDDGQLTCLNRGSLEVLWTGRIHDSAICRTHLVGSHNDQRVQSVALDGRCVLTDPLTGRAISSFKASSCDGESWHRHALEVAWDASHVLLRCMQPHSPDIIPVADTVAASGYQMSIHDRGGGATLMSREGRELGHVDTVKWPFVLGASTRVAYLRAPEHWVGVHDILTGDHIGACAHCFERGGYAIAISADERWVAWSGYEKYGSNPEVREFVRLVGLDPPEECGRNILWGDSEFTHLQFSADGSLLLAGDREGGISVATVSAGSSSSQVLGRVTQEVAAIAFADDNLAVAVGTSGEVCWWRQPS